MPVLPTAKPLIWSPTLGVPKELHVFSALRFLKRKPKDLSSRHVSASVDYRFL